MYLSIEFLDSLSLVPKKFLIFSKGSGSYLTHFDLFFLSIFYITIWLAGYQIQLQKVTKIYLMDKVDQLIERIGFRDFDKIPTLQIVCEKAFMNFIKPS